jgi:hypothetical protein
MEESKASLKMFPNSNIFGKYGQIHEWPLINFVNVKNQLVHKSLCIEV